MKELTDEVFFQEAYKLNVKRLYGYGLVSNFRTISKSSPYSYFNDNEKFSHKKMLELFSGISVGDERAFINPTNNNIYFVSAEVMLSFNGHSLEIIDNLGAKLGSFGSNSEDKTFQFHGNNFMFTFSNEHNPRKEELSFFINNEEEDSWIIDKKNKLIIDSSESDLTLIQIKKDTVLTKFTNPIYSSILFDYDLNIKEIEFSKNFKEELGLDKNFKLNDVSYKNGLINNIKIRLENNLVFYKLVNEDKEYIIETPRINFESEIVYIKSIINKNEDILNFYEKNKDSITMIKDYYEKTMSEYSKINHVLNNNSYLTSNLIEELGIQKTVLSNYIDTKEEIRNLKLLSFLVLKDKHLKKLIHPELLKTFKKLNDDSLNAMPAYTQKQPNLSINKHGKIC